VPAQHAAALRALALLSLLSALLALARGHASLAPAPLAVAATSLLYWARPTPGGLRRALDVGVVQLALLYQTARALRGAARRGAYLLALAPGLAAFPLSVLLDRRAQARGESSAAATLLHGAVHVFGNLANAALYSGDVPPIFGALPPPPPLPLPPSPTPSPLPPTA